MMMTRAIVGGLAAAMLHVAPAMAQDVPLEAPLPAEPPAAVDDGSDNFTIGLGVSYVPSYEGSDNYVISGAGLVRGRVSGFTFYSRATALYFDLVREEPGAPLNVEIGPMANVRIDRSSRLRDDRVKALGEIDTAIELGGFVGATKNKVFHDYDFASARLDVTYDVAGAHDSLVIAPNLEYATPLSTTFLLGASLSAEYVSGDFANTYYSVTPAGALASGLRAYDADGGWKNARGTLLATYSLSGDLRRGAAVFGVVSYSKLLGDFKRSPIVRDAGDSGQYFTALGLSYTF